MKTLAFFAAAALAASQAFGQDPAQLRLNEIYGSHTGTDNLEMIEVVGVPSAALTDYLVLIVEGDGTAAGILDRVWNLTGYTIPVDGFFVLGDTAEPALDYNIGTSDRIENGSNTFYVLKATDAAAAAAVAALLNTNLDPDGDLLTVLSGYGTIVDMVGVVDSGYPSTDKIFDGAQMLGPDGTFLPAGVFRSGDYPNPWCTHAWLDFDPALNAFVVRTPGALNSATCWWSVGAGCPDSGTGLIPTIALSGAAEGGGTLTLNFSNFNPGRLAALFLGLGLTTAPINPNCNLYLVPVNYVVFPVPVASFPASGVIPPVAFGFDLYLQVVTQDSVVVTDLMSSNALGVTIVP
ncbi:MAG: hypothetical protein HY812_21270 [Planctomycetes bacterium]|nr:hypothetical protein [Planctomycetota bacterium]